MEVKTLDNKKLLDKLYEVINNYIDNCSDTEWDRLLSEYNINNQENYMDEVRNNFIEAIMEFNWDESNKNISKIISRYNKYYNKDIYSSTCSYDDINFKELKDNYEVGDLYFLDNLKGLIPDDSNDKINKLYYDVLEYNEIYANDWTISNLIEMGQNDKYWLDRANNFIKKYNVLESEYNEFYKFYDKYCDLRNTLLNELGIDISIFELDRDKIPEKGFVNYEVITKNEELDDDNDFTVARLMNFCHCVKLHYSEGKATVEYGTKLCYDFWNNLEKEAKWFNKDMTEEEMFNKLSELFANYFGEEELQYSQEKGVEM